METLIIIIILVIVFSFFSIAPRAPTRKRDFERINKISNLKEKNNFIDLWSWTWDLIIYLAKENPQSKIIWIELSPFFYIISKINVFFTKRKNIEIIYWNALNLDFSKYNIIYTFWMPKAISKKIFPKIKSEMKSNSKFLSYCFEIEWEKDLIKHKENKNVLAIYEYRK